LKGAEPMFQYVLDDVSYPQLRELKRQTALPFRPIPPNVSYPQLRELKHGAAYTSGAFGLCILPATVGIETD